MDVALDFFTTLFSLLFLFVFSIDFKVISKSTRGFESLSKEFHLKLADWSDSPTIGNYGSTVIICYIALITLLTLSIIFSIATLVIFFVNKIL